MIALSIVVALLFAVLSATGNRAHLRIAPLAGLLPLALAFFPEQALPLPRILLGLNLEIDRLNRPLLLLVGVVWPLAGWYAQSHIAAGIRRFWTWWNATLAGVLLALLATDIVGFYAGYAATTLAAFGLIAHAGSPASRRAARIYLVMALCAELLVLYALLTLAGGGDPPARVLWLLFAGFAVKAGIVPLHVWLPLAHSIAPAPASAVLSGVIVKLGLLGWLRFVETELPAGAVASLIVLGLVTCFYAALVGLAQSRIKTVLAYSTVSQMGIATIGFALVLAGQPAAPVVLFALHHGLNKAALFVGAGLGVGRNGARLLLLALPAAALTGLPLSSGFLAKGELKEQMSAAGIEGLLPLLLILTALTTTLLMVRVLWLAWREEDVEPMHPAWPALVVASLILPWALGNCPGDCSRAGILQALWPVAAGVALSAAWLRWKMRGPEIPEGDLLALLSRIPRPSWQTGGGRRTGKAPRWSRLMQVAGWAFGRVENALLRLPGTGLALLLATAALWWLMR